MKSKIVVTMLLVLSFAGVASAAGKGDAKAGKAKSAVCVACHGANGKGVVGNDLWPKLAGQNVGYMVKQLKAFKDGTRKDPLMSAMAMPLSDVDIQNLAAYFAAVK